MALHCAPLHPWKVSPAEAIQIQQTLAHRVREEPLSTSVETIGGVDVSISGDTATAAVVVLSFPALEVLDYQLHHASVPFPYIPGLLSFREVPVICPALERLQVIPDVLMTDSQGKAHPRRFGLAAHLGILLDWPTFGVAKSRLIGSYQMPEVEKGNWTYLYDGEEIIGAVVRTRTGVKPVFVSVGHRITLPEAVSLTLHTTTRYRLPEPVRLAHHLSKRGRFPHR